MIQIVPLKGLTLFHFIICNVKNSFNPKDVVFYKIGCSYLWGNLLVYNCFVFNMLVSTAISENQSENLIICFYKKEPFSSIIIKFATEKTTQQLLCIN